MIHPQREERPFITELPKRTKRRSKRVPKPSIVQQQRNQIPLYSSIAAGGNNENMQTNAAIPAKGYPTKQNKHRQKIPPVVNGVVHSGDPPPDYQKNPKHRHVTGQYFVRYATENPNYPSKNKVKAPMMGATVYGNGYNIMYPNPPMNQVNQVTPYGVSVMNPYGHGYAQYPVYPQQVPPMKMPPVSNMGNVAYGMAANGVNNGLGQGFNVSPNPYLPNMMAMTPLSPQMSVNSVQSGQNGQNLQNGQIGVNGQVGINTCIPVPVDIPQGMNGGGKPVGAGKEQFGLCPMFGSAKGCRWGTECFFKHTDPNSVMFCPDFNSPEGCYFGNKCFNRHQTFVFVKRGERIPDFYPESPEEKLAHDSM